MKRNRPSKSLKLDLDRLEGIRFAAMDQNPHGIRDTLWSTLKRVEDMEKVLDQLKIIADPVELQRIKEVLGEV